MVYILTAVSVETQYSLILMLQEIIEVVEYSLAVFFFSRFHLFWTADSYLEIEN